MELDPDKNYFCGRLCGVSVPLIFLLELVLDFRISGDGGREEEGGRGKGGGGGGRAENPRKDEPESKL